VAFETGEVAFGDDGEVVLAVGGGEHAGATAPEGLGVDARAFERAPRGLQQQPLLRVHRDRFTRGDAEEAGVEVGGAVDEAALGDVGGALVLGVRVVQVLQVPAAIGGERHDRVTAVDDEVPELLRRPDPTRETAVHRDDGDGFLPLLLHLLQTVARVVQVRGHPLEVITKLLLVGHSTPPLHRNQHVSGTSDRPLIRKLTRGRQG
jgi:hypothetical protein